MLISYSKGFIIFISNCQAFNEKKKIARLSHAIFLCSLFLSIGHNAHALELCSHYITSGSTELSYYKVAEKIGTASGKAICALESYGSLENLHNLYEKNNVIAGLVQEDVLLAASRQKPEKLRILHMGFPIQTEVVHLLVNEASSYTRINDLGDGVVCVGKPTSGSYFTSLQVKALSNTPWVDAREDFPTCMQLLERGSVDAVFLLASPPVKSLEEKIGNDFRLIPIPRIHGYQSTTINHYTKKDPPEPPIESISVETYLVIDDNKVEQDSRLSNKLAMGMASIISELDTIQKDKICTHQFEDFGMTLSNHQHQACKLGYFGEDW